MREPYIPLFTSTIRSSLWSLSGDCLKVFLTLALEADPEGYVSSSIDGLRRLADLPLADVQRHIATLEQADPHSKDKTRDPKLSGARIERVPNGWRVVNIEWYREQARRQAELARKRRWWEANGASARRGARRTQTETETETQKETDLLKQEDPPTPAPPAVVFTLEGWAMPDELRADAKMQGLSEAQIEEGWRKLAEGPIGGKRGILRSKLNDYVRRQFPKWRTWAETDAQSASKKGKPSSPPKDWDAIEKKNREIIDGFR